MGSGIDTNGADTCMRIAEVCHRYSPYLGGIETHVAEIGRRLADKGHEVTVITTDPSGRLPKSDTIDGVEVLRFRSFAPGDTFYYAPGLSAYFKRDHGFDVIHAHQYHAFPALAASRARAPRFVFTPHYHGRGHTRLTDLLLGPYRLAGKRIFDRADRIICVSSYEKSLVCRDFGCDAKAVVIPNGVNKAEFEGLEPYPKGLKVILYVGRLEEYKGVQYILRALPHLRWHRLQIIGKGPYKDALVREAKALGVHDRVSILADQAREELLKWYATADVFAMLSAAESYGITVAEALSAGVPCVVARGSALSEFVGGSCRGVDLPVGGEALAGLIADAKFAGAPEGILDWDEVAERVLKVYQDGR